MATLMDYLLKRNRKAKALTYYETKYLGLPWPLPKGWPVKYGSMILNQAQITELTNLKAERKKEVNDKRKRKIKLKIDAESKSISTKSMDKAGFDAMPEKLKSLVMSDKFFESREWLALRYEALRVHGSTCQCCGASRKDGVVIHVDHIYPRSIYPWLALDISNLQVLCNQCNLGKGNRDITDWR